MTPYQFSKFYAVAFNQNYSSSDSWKMISNDFTSAVFKLVPEYEEFKTRANKAINGTELPFKGVSVLDKEMAQAEALKKEWLEFVDKFSKLEQVFESKYMAKVATFQEEVKNNTVRDEFLAEYSAYSYLATMYDSLSRFEATLDAYTNLCLKFKEQSQFS